MKIILNSIEDDKQADKIKQALYDLSEDIGSYYRFHVNYAAGSWVISCEPRLSEVPVLKLSTYISKSGELEKLKITPTRFSNFPASVAFNDYDSYLDTANAYITVFDFVSSLYDFEYILQ